MSNAADYALLDFGRDKSGAGRKLERFGAMILDRPAPAAESATKLQPAAWRQAHARYELDERAAAGQPRGRWAPAETLGNVWPIAVQAPGLSQPLALQLRATEFGHVGFFPEQAAQWAWLVRTAQAAARPLAVLNLFAYTGVSTLALAAAGATVTHVDAAATAVAWARRNAELSNLEQAPVRWICEDALKFSHRERKRGRRYDCIVLDPPSYGHGPRGAPWLFERHLPELLEVCQELLTGDQPSLLCTGHTQGVTPADLGHLVQTSLGPGKVATGELSLVTSEQASLPAGIYARWQSAE